MNRARAPSEADILVQSRAGSNAMAALLDCCNASEVCHLRCSHRDSLLRHLLLALMDCSDECCRLLLSISYELINCSGESNLRFHDCQQQTVALAAAVQGGQQQMTDLTAAMTALAAAVQAGQQQTAALTAAAMAFVAANQGGEQQTVARTPAGPALSAFVDNDVAPSFAKRQRNE